MTQTPNRSEALDADVGEIGVSPQSFAQSGQGAPVVELMLPVAISVAHVAYAVRTRGDVVWTLEVAQLQQLEDDPAGSRVDEVPLICDILKS